MIFHILEIEETKDETLLKEAYLNILKRTNPEDDPEGFKRLRQAYEEAVTLARIPDEDTAESAPKTEMDLWIDRVDSIYKDILSRCDSDIWEDVLADPLCEDLDTAVEARDALLRWMMDHIYLPEQIYKLLDCKFQIREDREELSRKFPTDFMNYIIYYMENPQFINYDLFRVLDRTSANIDAYIRGYFDLKRMADNRQYDTMEAKLEDLKAFGVSHPYGDVEHLRMLLGQNRTEEAAVIADDLIFECEEDVYVSYWAGEALWANGRKEEANQLWEEILKILPEHYDAKAGTVRYLAEIGEYDEAKARIFDLLDRNGQDENMLALMRTINEKLIILYRKKLDESETPGTDKSDEHSASHSTTGSRLHDTIELGWCLFQNDLIEEGEELLRDLVPDAEYEYSWTNLYSRLLYKTENYEAAYPLLKRWQELIAASPDDGSEENSRRKAREPQVFHMMSGCAHNLDKKEEALAHAKKGYEIAKDKSASLGCLQYHAWLLFQYKRYEECIDDCDQILREDSRYYPAYLQRQEAAFELNKGQLVVDDFYKAIDIFSEYFKPYYLAAKIFFYHNQHKDAMSVLTRAKENNVYYAPEMKLLEVQVRRNLATSREDREPLFALVKELLELKKQPDTKLEDPSEVEFEYSLLLWDNNEYDEAIEHIRHAMEENPDRLQYHLICGHLWQDKEQYQLALNEYSLAESAYTHAPTLHYNRGRCQEALGMKNLAMEHYEKTLELQMGFRDTTDRLVAFYKERYGKTYASADFEKALSYLNRQLEFQEDSYYLIERGRLYMMAYELDKAIADFEKALTYKAENWAAYNNMGCCYKYLGQFDKAIECLKKSYEFMPKDKPSPLPQSNLADCYEALFDFEKAIECYQGCKEIQPDAQWIFMEIGQLYSYLGKYDLALEYMNQAPEHSNYYENVASLYFRQGNPKQGEAFLKNSLAREKDSAKKAEILLHMTNYYWDALRDLRKAASCAKKAIALQTDVDKLYDYEWKLASLYFCLGKKRDAKVHAERSMEYFKEAENGTEKDYLNYKEFRAARLLRFGWNYIMLGETKKGLDMLRGMSTCVKCRHCHCSGCFEGPLYLGLYYEAIGDYPKAREYYQKGLELKPHSIELQVALRAVSH